MKKTVLLVDDDPFVLEVAARMLITIGLSNILTALSPAEALAIWQLHKDEIGILLTDINMPEMSGDELAAQLLQTDPDLELFFMSGNPPELLNTRIPLTPGVNFVQKPFTPQEFGKVLRRPYPSTASPKNQSFYAFHG
ncbi:MAG: response regulator [Limisphaerales bacterium]